MKRLFTTFVFLMALATSSIAQDQHFSQFYASPMTLNPALTGTFDGRYRLAIIYRDQWRSVLEEPYVTMGGAVDTRFPLRFRRKRVRDAVGVGVQFFSDRVPSVDFSTNQMMLSGAFHKALGGSRSNQFLSLGVQFGVNQRNIGYSRLDFGDQFNGNNGFTEPTREVLPENNFSFGDLSIGLNYTLAPERGVGIFVGGAIHHLLEPQVSFFIDRNPNDLDNFDGDNRLFRKYTAHFGMQIPMGNSVQLLPRAVIYKQGPHLAANLGSNIRFLLHDISGTALHVGSWARPVGDQNNRFGMDAIVIMTGLEFNNFLLGFSYDANLNTFSMAGRRRSAFEISLAFLGLYENEVVLCPKF